MAELNPTAASLLGFLHGGPASGYDLVGIAELKVGDFWSLTRSQVYRELADLARRGLIQAQPAGPRAKQPYELTDAGREAFAAWTAEPPSTEQIRYPLLLALSFGSLIDRDRLLGYVETHRVIHEHRLAGYRDLKAAGAEDRAVGHWSGLFAREISVSLDWGRLNALVDSVMAALQLLSPLALLGAGALLVLQGQLSLGTMLGLTMLGAGFLEPLAALVTTGLQLQLLGSYMARINDVLDTPAEQAGQTVQLAGRLGGRIEAEGLSFRYNPAGPLVVDDVSVQIRPGQLVAIVGRSGSGKSTLARLLLGLYEPEAGHVRYDQADLRDLEVRSLRRQLGIVTQESYVFGTSVRDNIALTAPGIAQDDVARAARLACIDEDILAMAMGYATVLVEGGASLSGGQRQRLVLARALAHRPSVLLLDEATSALDTVTEAAVYRNLASLDSTAIVIAHRLSTITRADLIVVMDGGKVVEQGTHDELLALAGHYQELVCGQARPGAAPESGVPT